MQFKNESRDETGVDGYIDKYLDGMLNEEEQDGVEVRCLEEKEFFLRVQERKELREKTELLLMEEGEELLSTYISRQQQHGRKRFHFDLAENIWQGWRNLKPVWKLSLIPASVTAGLLVFYFAFYSNPFRENSGLEKELGQIAYRSESIEVLSPRLGELIDDSLTFRWQTEAKGIFELQILNNKAELLYSYRTDQMSYTIQEVLPPGLYYWKLYQEYPLYTGKFFVKK